MLGAVLDLTDPSILTTLKLTGTDLIGDNYEDTQRIAAAAESAGFAGILAPSAALPGRRTLVVFASAAAEIHEELSRVRQPPPRLADLLQLVRPLPATPRAVHNHLARTAALGSAVIRRRRR